MAYRLQKEKVGVLTLAESRSPLTSSWHPNVLGWKQADIIVEHLELATDLMGRGASLHAVQAG
jgi:hypothetical protein